MDNLGNKTFKDNKTGEEIKIIDSFENIAILENLQRVDVRKLMDKNLYTEMSTTNNNQEIDPANFFNNQNAYNSLADKIKSISTDNLIDEDIASKMGGDITPTTNESAVYTSSIEDEREELARKYGASVDNISSTNRQNEAFSKLLGEEGAEELPRTQQRHQEPPVWANDDQPVQHIDVKRDDVPNLGNYNVSVNTTTDPIITMFKGVKRNVDFKMSVEISNKIPRLDFIEMMEDSYETSIIDFLAEEFTNKLLDNPQQLKTMISDRIKQVVYGGEIKKKEVIEVRDITTDTPLTKRVIPKVPLNETDKMTEGVKKKSKKVIPHPPSPPEDRVLKEGSLPKKRKITKTNDR